MSYFNLLVNTLQTQGTVNGEISIGQAKGNDSSTGAGAWGAVRDIGSYFHSIADGSVSASVQYSDGLTPATGTLTFSGNLSNNDTVTIAGVLVTFVTGVPSGSQVKVGASQAATIANFLAFVALGGNALNLAPYITAVQTSANLVTLTAAYPGQIGNLITLAKVAANIAVSGATFTGGAISAGSQAPIAASCGR